MSWVAWSPPFAPHVAGAYETREEVEEGEEPRPQKVVVECRECGEDWAGYCSTGSVREKVATFAIMHLHRDPMAKRKEG